MKKTKILLPLLTAAVTVFSATFGVACSGKNNKPADSENESEPQKVIVQNTDVDSADLSPNESNKDGNAQNSEQQFDGLEVKWVGTSNTVEADTFELSSTEKSVEINALDIEVREVNEEGVAFGEPIAQSEYTVELYNGDKKVELTDGKATVSDGGTYQVWAYKNSSRVENYVCKGFARVYVMNSLLSMKIDKNCTTTQVAGREDLITHTWTYTLTYNNWNKKELSASDVTVTGFNPKKSGEGEATATYREVNAKGEYKEISCKIAFNVTGKFTPNMLVLDPSEIPVGSYNSEIADKYLALNEDGNAVTDGSLGSIKVLADANGGDIEVKEQTATIEGNTITNRLDLRGKGSKEARSIQLNLTGAAVVTVYAVLSSAGTRTLALYDENFDLVDESCKVTETLAGSVLKIDKGGTYYLSSVSGGIRILYLLVEYEN